jgi:hypothetical protein
MKRRNPSDPQRRTAANARKTEERVSQYYGIKSLLDTWELQPEDVQIREHDYLIRLRAKLRTCRNLILHRADPSAIV